MCKFIAAMAGVLMATAGGAAHAHAGHQHAASMHQHAAAGHHQTVELPDPASVSAPDGISVKACWIRALPNRLPAAAYFLIENAGHQDKVLIAAQADGFGKVMLHAHVEAGGMARMVHVDKVVVPGEGSFEFAPRGHHVMLEQAEFDLEVGSRRDITLWFEGPEALSVSCDVRPPGTLQ